MKIFLDANVLFAAAYNPGGTPSHMIAVAKSRGIQLITSHYAYRESQSNLERKSPNTLQAFDRLMQNFHFVTTPDLIKDQLALRKKDLPIYRSALFAGCSYLITGDKRDFSGLKKKNAINLIKILSPSEFLHEMNNLCD